MDDISFDLQILIVDDSASMRRIVKKFLENTGFHKILEASNGVYAMDRVQNESIDLIISDLNMPNMDGLELLKAVRSNSSTKDIPFIMLTVEAIQRTMNKAIALDVDSYIVKPVTQKLFIEEMIRVIRSKNKG